MHPLLRKLIHEKYHDKFLLKLGEGELQGSLFSTYYDMFDVDKNRVDKRDLLIAAVFIWLFSVNACHLMRSVSR